MDGVQEEPPEEPDELPDPPVDPVEPELLQEEPPLLEVEVDGR